MMIIHLKTPDLIDTWMRNSLIIRAPLSEENLNRVLNLLRKFPRVFNGSQTLVINSLRREGALILLLILSLGLKKRIQQILTTIGILR